MAKRGKDFKMNTPFLKSKDLDKMAHELVNAIRHITFNKSNPKMANDAPFPSYSVGYKKSKKTGKLRRQDSSYASSTAPYLTGDLYRDLTPKKSNRGNKFSIGWNTHAYKIDSLEKKGRVLTSNANPVNPRAMARVMPTIGKALDKVLVNGTQHIKMGKKK